MSEGEKWFFGMAIAMIVILLYFAVSALDKILIELRKRNSN
jgi:hypothetical protein